MRAYEIHTYQDGRWKIDSVFDDRELALFEARRVDAGNRYSGVRVVEETFDESSQSSLTRTIFRGGRAESNAYGEGSKPGGGPRPHVAPAARGGVKERERREKAAKTTKRKKKKSFVMPLVILFGLLVVGIAGMLGLQALFDL